MVWSWHLGCQKCVLLSQAGWPTDQLHAHHTSTGSRGTSLPLHVYSACLAQNHAIVVGSGQCCALTHTVCITCNTYSALHHTETSYSFTVGCPKHLIIISFTHAVRDSLSFNLTVEPCSPVRAGRNACLSLPKHGDSMCWQVALHPHVLRKQVWAGCVSSMQRKGCRHEQATLHQGLRPLFLFCDLLKGSKPMGSASVWGSCLRSLSVLYEYKMRWNSKQINKCGRKPHLPFSFPFRILKRVHPVLGSSDGEGVNFSFLCPLVSIYNTRHHCDKYLCSGVNGYRRKWYPVRIPAKGFCTPRTPVTFKGDLFM